MARLSLSEAFVTAAQFRSIRLAMGSGPEQRQMASPWTVRDLGGGANSLSLAGATQRQRSHRLAVAVQASDARLTQVGCSGLHGRDAGCGHLDGMLVGFRARIRRSPISNAVNCGSTNPRARGALEDVLTRSAAGRRCTTCGRGTVFERLTFTRPV